MVKIYIIIILLIIVVDGFYNHRNRFIANNRFKMCIGDDNYRDTLNSLRSAARMSDAVKLEELIVKLKSSNIPLSILNDKAGDAMGLSIIHWAVASGSRSRSECLSILLNAGAEVDTLNSSGYQPLHYSCSTSKTECAAILLDFGSDINAKVISTGQNSIHLCCCRGDEDTLVLLLSRGARINDVDINGDSPLHFARRFNKQNIEKILIDNGIDINIKNFKGYKAGETEPTEITNYSYE